MTGARGVASMITLALISSACAVARPPAAGDVAAQVAAEADPTSNAEADPTAASGATRTTPGGSAAVRTPGRSAAPGTPGAADGSGPGGGPASGNGSTEPIRIGFPYVDDAALVAVGFPPAYMREATSAYVGEINDQGGINGRPIESVFDNQGSTPEQARASCIRMTDEQKVFAVVNHALADYRCIAAEQGTLVISSAQAPDWQVLEQMRPWYWTSGMQVDPMMQFWADWIGRHTDARNKRVGIVYEDTAENVRVLNEVLLPKLAPYKLNIVERIGHSNDQGTQQAQAQTAILKMKGSNVDFVIPFTQTVFMAVFLASAQAQNFEPEYTCSPWLGLSSDYFTKVYADGWEGTVCVDYVRKMEDPAASAAMPGFGPCREVFERANPGLEYGDAPKNYCNNIRLFAVAARAAGPDLTAASVVQALEAIGPWQSPSTGPASFGRGKYWGADQMMTTQWHFECKCYHQIGPWVSGF